MPAAGEVRRDQEYESDSGLLIAAVLLFSNLALWVMLSWLRAQVVEEEGKWIGACSWAPLISSLMMHSLVTSDFIHEKAGGCVVIR